MNRHAFKTRLLALAVCAVIVLGAVWNGALTLKFSAAGESFYPLSGFKNGERPQESPWFYNSANFSETPSDTVQMPDEFSKPVNIVPASIELLPAPQISVISDRADSTNTSVKLTVYEADEYLINLYSINSDGEYVFIRTDKTVTAEHKYTDLAADKRYAIQVIGKNGGKCTSASDIVCFTVSVEQTSDFIVTDYGSDIAKVTLRPNSMKESKTVEYADSPTGTAYALTYNYNDEKKKYTDDAKSFKNTFTYDNSLIPSHGLTAAVFWIDTTDADKGAAGDNTPMRVFKLINSKNNSEMNIYDNSKVTDFYLIDSSGNKKTVKSVLNPKAVFIPHNFKGYFIIPLSETLDYSVYDQFFMWRYGKNITVTPEDMNRTLYISAIGFFSGKSAAEITKNDLKITDPSKGMHLNTVPVEKDTVSSCSDFDAAANTLSGKFGVSYSFYNELTQREITAQLNDDGVNKYGISLEFAPAQNGIYDVSHALSVKDNTALTGRLYYRVSTQDGAKNRKPLYPAGGGWYTLDVNNNNPKAEIAPLEAEIENNGKLFIEAYFASDSGNGGKLKISLGNPTVTLTNKKYDYKGFSSSYKVYDYHYKQLITDSDKKGRYDYIPQSARFNFNAMKYQSGAVTVNECTKFDTGWENEILYPAFSDRGYKINNNNVRVAMKNNCGISLDFISPDSGTVTLSTSKVTTNGKTGNVYARVLKNGDVIFPKSGDWATLADASFFGLSNEAAAQDKITLQMYSDSADSIEWTLWDLTFGVSGGNEYNLPTDDEFAALLERPYRGRDYIGKFTADENAVWSFDLISGTSASGLVPTAVNNYDSKRDSFLYHDSIVNSGYHFLNNQLTFDALGSSSTEMKDGRGFSLTMNVKENSLYDLSTAFSIINGSGTAYLRIKKNGERIWPAADEWYTVSAGANGIVPAVECAAVSGDELTVEAMAVTPGRNDIVTIGLGSPSVRKVSPKVAVAEGYKSIYAPADYAPLIDKNFSGAYIPSDGRWNFNLLKRDGFTVIPSEHYNNINGFIGSADGKAGTVLNKSEIIAKLSDKLGVSLDFASQSDGFVALNLPIQAADGAHYRIMLDEKQIFPQSGWAEADGVLPDISGIRILKGQKLKIQIYADKACELNLGTVSAAMTSDHSNAPQYGETSFGALYASPYGSDNYSGEYKPQEGLWSFGIINGDSKETASADYYSFADGKRLYGRQNGAGYYFGDSALSAELTNTAGVPYGTALGFTAPENMRYDFQSDFTVDADASVCAKFFARVLKNGKALWPAEGEWYEQEAHGGETLDIPAYEADAKAGDKIVLEIYADEIKGAGSVKLTLGNPSYSNSHAFEYNHTDVSARVYASQEYNPFGNLTYQGAYTPAEGRWNYEILDASDPDRLKVLKANNYNSNSKMICNTNAASTGFYVGVSGSVGNSEINVMDGKAYGTNLRFVSPVSAKMLISGAAYINGTANVPEGAKVKFRVLVNDKVVYPENGGWTEMNGEIRSSGFGGVWADLKAGDNVIYQCYPEYSGGNMKLSVLVNNPSVLAVTNQSKANASYNARADFTKTYQISPFWSYEYKSSKKDSGWSKLETYGTDGYWMAKNMRSYMADGVEIKEKLGVAENKLIIFNSLKGSSAGAAAYRFDIPESGEFTINAAQKITAGGDMLIRITKNGEKIWPESDWQQLSKASGHDFERRAFSFEKGDVIRFEAAAADSAELDKNYIVNWIPVISRGGIEEDISIYSFLSDDELKYFKKIETKSQFDIDYESNKKAAAEAGKKPDGNITADNNNGDGNNYYYPGGEYIPGTPGTDGYWVPGSEDTVTRVIKRTIVTSGMPIWEVVLIICGSVLVAGAVITLIILKKKGIIGKKTVKASDS